MILIINKTVKLAVPKYQLSHQCAPMIKVVSTYIKSSLYMVNQYVIGIYLFGHILQTQDYVGRGFNNYEDTSYMTCVLLKVVFILFSS